MKKIVFMMLAMMAMTTAASAQCASKDSCSCKKQTVCECKNDCMKKGKKAGKFKKDKAEMVAHRTEMMVKKYALTDEQAAKVKTLNEKYADVMRGPKHMMKGGHPMPPKEMKDGERPEPPKDFKKGQKPEPPKEMQEYETELKKIMTDKQYKAYQADKEKRMQKHEQKD